MSTFILYVDSKEDVVIEEEREEEEVEEKLCLLSFNISILNIILTQFLTINDVGLLDTAYCSKKKRRKFLNILSNEYIMFDNVSFDETFESIDDAMIYIGKRNINIINLSVKRRMKYNYNDNDFHSYRSNLSDHLTDNGLIGLSKYCSNLRSLDISLCENITDIAMIEVIKNCNLLQSLNISCCKRISGNSIVEISNHCSNLKALDISGCIKIKKNSGIKELTENCNIESLNFSGCWEFSDTAVIGRNCSNIKSLNLSGCNGVVYITEIINNCKKLELFNISALLSIHDNDIKTIAINCNQNLQSLDISFGYFNDSSIIEVARNCTNLEYLNLNSCIKVTDNAIIEIGLHCKNLQYINLKGCNKITNIGILEIVRQCRNLKSLECKKLTDDNMIEISQLLPNLSITMGMR